jgi:hypothetical protein
VIELASGWGLASAGLIGVVCRFGPAQILGACLVGTGAVIVAGGGLSMGAFSNVSCSVMYGLSLVLMAYSAVLRETHCAPGTVRSL